jgi:hypothetical protein
MKVLKAICILLIVFLAYSCKTGYVPSGVNTPMLTQKNQVSGTADALFIGDIQGAYSITNHLLVLGDISSSFATDNPTGAYSYSGGAGYFNTFSKKQIIEVIAGGGQGFSDYQYNKFYFQTTYAKSDENFEFGFTTRGVMANYPSVKLQNGNTISTNDFFIEPVGTFRVGAPNIKFHMQLGLSLPLVYTSETAFIPFIMNIGVNVKFPGSSSE